MTTQADSPVAIDSEAETRVEHRKCFACHATATSTVRDFRDHHASTGRLYNLRLCSECGTAQLAVTLTRENQEAIYPPTFYSYDVTGSRSRLVRILHRLRYNRHRFRPTFRRLLEVGSGCGEFLAAIRTRGEVVGLERSNVAFEKAQDLGVDVRVGNVEDTALFEASSFDYAYLSHSLEHLDDPEAALRSLSRWLTDDGRIFIAVPNFDGALPKLSRRSWYNLALPLHVSQFTPRGLAALLARTGFTIDRTRYNSDPISIPMSLYFAASGDVKSMNTAAKVVLHAFALLCVPLSRTLDLLRLGDCVEIHARKTKTREGSA